MKRWFKHITGRHNFPLFFDRSFSKGFRLQVAWLLLMMVAVYLLLIILSYSGIFYNSSDTQSKGRWYDVLFFLISPGSPNEHIFAPFALIITLIGMVIFSGMLISVISNILARRIDSYTQGETSYNVSGHIAILGFNRSIPSLLKKTHNRYPESYILLMCERNSMEIRDWLHANVDSRIEHNLIVLNGDINADDDLHRLNLTKSPKEIYILGEENIESHDDTSLECVKKVSGIIGKSSENKIPCFVQINSDSMFSLLQQVDFCKQNGEQEIRNITFHPFNFNEIWSQKVLSLTSFRGHEYFPLDGEGIRKDSLKRVHLIIVGMTGLGKALATNAAHVLHFPNFKEGDFDTYTRITFIDPKAEELGNRFRNRHSVLFQLARWKDAAGWHDPLADKDSESPFKHLGPDSFLDVEWEFMAGDIANSDIRRFLKEACHDERSRVTIALCGDDSERNLAIAMGLPEEVLTGESLNMVLVRQKESEIAIELMQQIPLRGEKLRGFGMLNECYSENLLNDSYGKLINALYWGISIDSIEEETRKRIEKAWENCSITDKWSSNYSANMLFIKLRSLGLNPENISEEKIAALITNPEIQEEIKIVEHNRWVTERILLGFSPLLKEEQDEFRPFDSNPDSEDAERIRKMTKEWAKSTKKHLDICSNRMLREIDPKVAVYDKTVNEAMWSLYEMITKPRGTIK